MNEWIGELRDLSAAGEPAVLVTVAGIRGSAPREIGAKMIVTDRETIGTIGGGQLEYQSTRIAVGMLGEKTLALRSFPLGASLGQCCGGVVEILFEPIDGGMPAWLRDLAALHGQREPAVLVTRISRSAPLKYVVTADGVYGIGEEDADAAVQTLFKEHEQLMVERFVAGKELTVGVIEGLDRWHGRPARQATATRWYGRPARHKKTLNPPPILAALANRR